MRLREPASAGPRLTAYRVALPGLWQWISFKGVFSSAGWWLGAGTGEYPCRSAL